MSGPNTLPSSEEKIVRVKQTLASLKLPVGIYRVAVHGLNKYAVGVNSSVVGYLEPDKGSFESLLAEAIAIIFKAEYKTLRRHVKDKETLARKAYYHVVGYLGNLIASDLPEESKRKPIWLKRFPKYSPLFLGPYNQHFNVDHVFYSRAGEFISEPYVMTMRDFENLVRFCREHGLKFTVRGESRHFPGHTFRVIIKPEEGR